MVQSGVAAPSHLSQKTDDFIQDFLRYFEEEMKEEEFEGVRQSLVQTYSEKAKSLSEMISRVSKQVEQQSYHFAIRQSIVAMIQNKEVITKEYVLACYEKWLCSERKDGSLSTVRNLEVRVVSSHALVAQEEKDNNEEEVEDQQEGQQESQQEGQEANLSSLDTETAGFLTHKDYLSFKAARELSTVPIISFPHLSLNA